jgi:small GTP-binding protein
MSKINIGKRYCGDRKNCTFCQYREESSSINFKIKDEKDDIVNKLTNWLNQLIINLSEVQSTFIIDYDGFIVAQNTREETSEEYLERIINMVSPTLEKIKSYSEPSNTSGTLINDDFRLFYLEMGGPNSALLVIVSKSSYKIQKSLPYIYFIADNMSSLLNGHSLSHALPDIKGSGDLSLPLSQEQNTSKNFVYPIFLIGPPKSGKTTFVHSIINNKVRTEYKPTIGLSIYKKNYQISKDLYITFLFFDIGALQTIFEARKEYYNLISPKILLCMFDISQLSSINKLKELIEESIHYFGNRPKKVILIGNKIDKIKINNNMENHISSIRKQYNCPYFEISALDGEDSERILTYLISNLDLKEGIMRSDPKK